MSVKIWCLNCSGTGNVPHDKAHPEGHCDVCFGLGCIVKGCENCGNNPIDTDRCDAKIWVNDSSVKITFCTAWEKKDETK